MNSILVMTSKIFRKFYYLQFMGSRFSEGEMPSDSGSWQTGLVFKSFDFNFSTTEWFSILT